MTEIYNLRIGDLLYKEEDGKAIAGVVYKLTAKYVYYAICASNQSGRGPAYVTKDHRVSKEKLYSYLGSGDVEISYASGTLKRKKVDQKGI